ncbi:MAG: CDP-diacylglycerol--serine O-phosphatidyltransferase [Candidatus Margulisiibacteriota bacterium]|nr:MAG: CDP-diacylglycerol--serine O-phosphatidyltransferase [Candidatus Margulisbacteria bacterium GWD2_39_127]OGI02862.1 MAG: CDP-diacylglycerol--serine O-phosphatidyltransferase [Candidatus Margulisbacteria bacterium GWF2_38_17]OGI09643.1 MAG: CDP-diacylglycerol--serine O-phosphatidyltransferase [Candidatus Margulisbacteria bacterium GWE2_39_32]PZM83031.1 MAG: CDP-diacylglycerol--serine O-phosphatidyltransferase [Candidatus Margulisiibacteriota bacterium]HAR62191.1 CDP-diacylglycerol--serine
MKRGIYILPNLLTISGMFCGFYSIIASINGHFLTAALIIIAAGIFDVLDGKIARLTHTTSHFGIELDSLSDILSFGIAPSLLIYLSMLKPFGKIGWMAAFLFVACCAMRLARFNVITKNSSIKCFVGLPTPAAAGVILSYIVFSHSEYSSFLSPLINNPALIAAIVYLLSILMVSNFKYHGLKELDLKNRKPFSVLITIVFLGFTIISYYKFSLLIIGLLYMISGPCEYIVTLLRNKQPHPIEAKIEIQQ